jgi:hypothetical protein
VLTDPSPPAKSKTVAKGTTKRKTSSDNKKPVPVRPPAPSTRHTAKK